MALTPRPHKRTYSVMASGEGDTCPVNSFE